MRFDRGLRSVLARPYPLGYTAAPTDGLNTEKAQCHLGGMKDAGVWLTEGALPASIEIQVHLTPIWVDDRTARAQLGDNAPCVLYLPQTVFSKVQVEAAGTGNYQQAPGKGIPFVGTDFLGYRLILPQPFLYQKIFQTQMEGRLVYQDPSQTEREEIPRLWAYGAEQVGDDIHPFVFTLEAMGDQTVVQPSSLLVWRERGMSPFGESGAFQDPFEEDQTRTLFESIEAGMSIIHLEVGRDENGQPLAVPYQSYRLSKNFIFYKKQEE